MTAGRIEVVRNEALQRFEVWRGGHLFAWIRLGGPAEAHRLWWGRVFEELMS